MSQMLSDLMAAREWADQHEAALIRDLMGVIQIRSFSEAGTSSHPYGDGCASALDYMLNLAQKFGFTTENHEYFCGSVLYPGETEKELAICCHLDIVPEGDGWLHPPFLPYLKDGWIYGRGSADNKGASVASLYLLKYLKEREIKFHHTIRLIYGCAEEVSMSDMVHYLEHHPAPDFVLVPDAALPAAYAEKAGIDAWFSHPLSGNLLSFSAGHALNCLPTYARCSLIYEDNNSIVERLQKFEGIKAACSSSVLNIESNGIAAHAGYPERGKSAAVKLAEAILLNQLYDQQTKPIFEFIAAFGKYDGSAFGINAHDEPSGNLVMSGCRIITDNNTILHSFNCRGPVTVPQSEIWETMEASALRFGWTPVEKHFKPFNFISSNHPVIEILTRNSIAAHGIQMKPYAMSGGTYARMFPRAVASGFGLPGQKKPGLDGHGGGHQPDECVSLLNLKNGIAIYAQSLIEMDCLFEF